MSRTFSKEQILASLRKFYADHGRMPKAADLGGPRSPPAAKYFVYSEGLDPHATLLEFHTRDGDRPANECPGLTSTSASNLTESVKRGATPTTGERSALRRLRVTTAVSRLPDEDGRNGGELAP
jgi:hypothetical protein